MYCRLSSRNASGFSAFFFFDQRTAKYPCITLYSTGFSALSFLSRFLDFACSCSLCSAYHLRTLALFRSARHSAHSQIRKYFDISETWRIFPQSSQAPYSGTSRFFLCFARHLRALARLRSARQSLHIHFRNFFGISETWRFFPQSTQVPYSCVSRFFLTIERL